MWHELSSSLTTIKIIMTWVTIETMVIRTTGSAHNDHYSPSPDDNTSKPVHHHKTYTERNQMRCLEVSHHHQFTFLLTPANVSCFDGTKICPCSSHLVPKTVSADQISGRPGKCSLKWNVSRDWKWSEIANNQQRRSGLGLASIMDITTSYNLHFKIYNSVFGRIIKSHTNMKNNRIDSKRVNNLF